MVSYGLVRCLPGVEYMANDHIVLSLKKDVQMVGVDALYINNSCHFIHNPIWSHKATPVHVEGWVVLFGELCLCGGDV